MTQHPTELAKAVHLKGPYQAGGGDLARVRRLGLAPGEPVALRALAPLRGITWSDDGLRIGAMVTLRELAGDEEVRRRYPALHQAVRAIANPQVRSFATVGGNVLQDVRCDYFGHPDAECLRKGGIGCPAREGHHEHAAVFGTGPCTAPHPSSLATVFACYDAVAQVEGRGRLGIEDLLLPGVGAGGSSRPHALAPGEVLTSFHLPPPGRDERGVYVRVSRRALADWPLVEVALRGAGTGSVVSLRVMAGAVAAGPYRLVAVEDHLVAGPATPSALRAGASLAAEGATPLPGDRYRLRQLEAAVLDALERCWPSAQ
ncbi:FAD binding domain-containing protein [Streptomyces lydicus]|uniref:FAD binding domain-containing protein n=1 Tax=Streptomyces lydicus TaxID=47763 RepID=UPI00379D9BFD